MLCIDFVFKAKRARKRDWAIEKQTDDDKNMLESNKVLSGQNSYVRLKFNLI